MEYLDLHAWENKGCKTPNGVKCPASAHCFGRNAGFYSQNIFVILFHLFPHPIFNSYIVIVPDRQNLSSRANNHFAYLYKKEELFVIHHISPSPCLPDTLSFHYCCQ